MTTTMMANGQLRKSLGEQIDRLDGILATLPEMLHKAVAEAVGVAVQQAVQAVMTELLTNAELLAKVRGVTAPPMPVEPKPSVAPTRRPSVFKRAFGAVFGAVACWLGVGYS